MFRRKLKKEKSKYRVKLFILILLLLTLLVVSGEYLFLNFSFGRANFISPVAKEPKFKSSPSGPSGSLSNLLNKNKVFYNNEVKVSGGG